MAQEPHIIAVVVTYKPDLTLFTRMLKALAVQIDGLVLVDNGSGPAACTALDQLLSEYSPDIEHQTIFQQSNLGIGQAQNAGIALAAAMGSTFILLMDQDSCPAPDMVRSLQSALAAMQAQNQRPAVIGPNYTEPKRLEASLLPAKGNDVTQMRDIISSGMLIPLDAFAAIGPFDEGLFVDFVDIEWCLRARACGYECFVARNAGMQHQIGGPSLRVLGRNIAVHNPERSYYQMRNILLLSFRASTPRLWAIRKIGYTLGRNLLLSILSKPRSTRAGMTAKAFWHGLCGKTGPFER